jgi:putative RNA 2'-phosphotransferase
MKTKAQVKTSKFLSLVLRHKPEEAGITLSEAGWCPVAALLKGCAAHGHPLTREELEGVVEGNDKKRFQFSDDGKLIRAVQGHSVQVNLKYEPSMPPEVLYHGTATSSLSSIKRTGLIKGRRQQVHLSGDSVTARKVGMRHGSPIVIPVSAGEMYKDGILFYHTPNGVWLVDEVPRKYLQFDSLLWSP